MADIGKAYVEIIPKAPGISGKITGLLGGEAKSAGTKAGKDAGDGFGASIKKTLAGLAIGASVTAGFKAALDEGGKLQQSYGGLETIYGDAAEAAKKYAKEAAQAGISANSYAEQAVSFGASLKQAFEGDTAKAVEAANVAILDMTDNAAKMGTPLESIQNAYAGFAKQNYTMLDNLKLGYGGTKSEMERLLADATKLTGVEYNIDNLGDVYAAIHAIQGDLGLTGVAAAEASETFSGSFEAMKASAANLAGALALGEDVGESMQTLVKSASTFVFGNLLPMVGTIAKEIPSALSTAFTTAVPIITEKGGELISGITSGITTKLPELGEKAREIIGGIAEGITTNLPLLLEKGNELAGSIVGGLGANISAVLPQIASFVSSIVSSIAGFITTNAPVLISGAAKIVKTLAQGIVSYIPTLATKAVEIVTKFAQMVTAAAPGLIAKGAELLASLISGIGSMIPKLGEIAGNIISNIVQFLSANLPQLAAAGGDMLGALAEAIIANIPKVVVALANLVPKVIQVITQLVPLAIRALLKIVPLAINAAGRFISGIVSGIRNGFSVVGSAVMTLVDAKIGTPMRTVIAKVRTIFNNVRNTMVSIWNSIKSRATALWNGIKTAIVTPLESAKSKVSGIISTLKGFFPLSVGKIFSNIKLPHFNISGGSAPWGIGGMGTKPSISIDWYKKAMNQPYVFDTPTLFGAGEAGDEMMYGRANLMNDIREAVSGQPTSTTYNITINVDGAEAPEDYARRLARQLQMELRMA